MILILITELLVSCGSKKNSSFFYALRKKKEFTYEGEFIRFDEGAKARLTRRIILGIDQLGDAVAELKEKKGIESFSKSIYKKDIYHALFSDEFLALEAANQLSNRPGIRFAHPDFEFELEERSTEEANPPNDPYYADAWHLQKTETEKAWRMTQGSIHTIIAVIDLGFEQNHPDMEAAWFLNKKEIGNGKDDDKNGYTDDLSGWNFATNRPQLIYGMNASHGSAVSGIIAARSNDKGSIGICPLCKVLPLVIDASPSTAAEAFSYAAKNGASVISNSWGYKIGTPQTDVLMEVIREVSETGRDGKGIPIVFAMDNRNRDNCQGRYPDISSLPFVLAVSSVDRDDVKIENAGYGDCLDLVAPSSGTQEGGITTTDRPGLKGYNKGELDSDSDYPDGDYTKRFYGTSAAAPQVAGAIGLVLSYAPDLRKEQIFHVLTDHAEKVSASNANYDSSGRSDRYGYGRLHLGHAMQAVQEIKSLP